MSEQPTVGQGGPQQDGPPSSPNTFMQLLKTVGKELGTDHSEPRINGPVATVFNRKVGDISGPAVSILGEVPGDQKGLPPVEKDVGKPEWLAGSEAPPTNGVADSSPSAADKGGKKKGGKKKKSKNAASDVPLTEVMVESAQDPKDETTVSGVVKGGEEEGKTTSSAPKLTKKKGKSKSGKKLDNGPNNNNNKSDKEEVVENGLVNGSVGENGTSKEEDKPVVENSTTDKPEEPPVLQNGLPETSSDEAKVSKDDKTTVNKDITATVNGRSNNDPSKPPVENGLSSFKKDGITVRHIIESIPLKPPAESEPTKPGNATSSEGGPPKAGKSKLFKAAGKVVNVGAVKERTGMAAPPIAKASDVKSTSSVPSTKPSAAPEASDDAKQDGVAASNESSVRPAAKPPTVSSFRGIAMAASKVGGNVPASSGAGQAAVTNTVSNAKPSVNAGFRGLAMAAAASKANAGAADSSGGESTAAQNAKPSISTGFRGIAMAAAVSKAGGESKKSGKPAPHPVTKSSVIAGFRGAAKVAARPGSKPMTVPGLQKLVSDAKAKAKEENEPEDAEQEEEGDEDDDEDSTTTDTASTMSSFRSRKDDAVSVTSKKSAVSRHSTISLSQRLLIMCNKGEWLGVECFLRNVDKREVPKDLADEETGYTPLMYAVRDNRLIVAEMLLGMGCLVNMRAKDGTTALFLAAANVREDMVKLLLQKKADPMIYSGPKGQLPIHVLCTRPTGAALAPLQLLLRAFGKEGRLLTDKQGDIPLILAAECGNHGVCKELLLQQTKEQLNSVRPSTGDSVVHFATVRRDYELLKLFIEQGAHINAQNNKGETALHYVARDGDEPMVKYFYNHGANPDLCDIYDQTPLHLAAANGHNGVIELLIEKFKASIFLRTKSGDTLMHIASKAGFPQTAMIFMKKGVPLHMPNKSGAKCLHTAALVGHVDVVKTLLQKGEQVDAKTNDNFTALHIAVQANQPRVVEMLLGYGAQVQIKAGKEGESPLHIAARVKNGMKCTELLIKSGAEVNVRQENGETPLHVAAKFGHLETVQLLLQDGAGTDIKTNKGETPLHVAVRNCHFPVANSLLKHWKEGHTDNGSALVNEQNDEGETAMHYAAAIIKEQLHFPTEDREMVKLLVQSGADVNMENNAMKETPIHYCSREGNVDVLKEMLEHLNPAQVQWAFNKQAKNGWSPLLYASRMGHVDLVVLLLKNSGRVDVFDEGGKAALHLAAEYGHDEVVSTLLKHGAFVNTRSKKGLTPLHLAARNGYTPIVEHLVVNHGAVLDGLTLIKKTPLHLAAEKGQLDVCSILLQLRADANAVDNQGQTPLLLAAENDHPEIVKLFLHHKPELVSMANSSGFTCAHIAAMKGSVAVIKQLMKFNRHLVTTARNKNNNTALHLAAAGGHAKLVKVLLEAGASATDENSDGYTALHLAAKFGHVKVLQALKTAMSWRVTSKKTGMAALHIAASFGQTDFVREMLTQLPANIRSERPADGSCEDYGYTPLHLAADNGHEGTVRVLLNSTGVQTDAATELQGVLALHMAARGGHLAAAGLLLSRSTEQLHAADKQGRTPLHLAAANGHREMVGLLLGQGSDFNAGDNNGFTALHYTARNGCLGVVQLLIDSGASPSALTKDGKVPLCVAASAGHYEVLKYLLKREHDTQTLMDDKTFLVDLMVAGKRHNNKPILDFILVSSAPIDTAVKMARSYVLLSLREKDRARDLASTAAYCETMATDLLSIAAMSYNTGTLLRAVDVHGCPFLDVLIELQQKEVVAHPAVQKYLSDLWMGSLKWSAWKIVFLFFMFLVCPITWIACSVPLGHSLPNIPIIKFMSYLASHIFFILCLVFTIINPWMPLWEATLIPHPQEGLVLLWLIGILVADVTNPKDREGLGYIKVAIMAVTSMAIVVHFISYLFEGRDRLVVLYARNQLLAVSLLFCFLEFLNFLTFHHLFGPWTVIIRDLIKDLLRFLAILAIFLVGFSLHVCAIYQPVFMPPGNATAAFPILGQVFQSPLDTFEMLFFALFGLVEPDYLPPMHLNPPFSKIVMKVVFGVYMMVTVIVLINLLIAMMSNTYQRIQAQSDTEWKFGRAKLIRNMNKTNPSPSPLNVFTVLPVLFWKWRTKCLCRKPAKVQSPLQSKRSSILERSDSSAAPKVWLERTRQRKKQLSQADSTRSAVISNLSRSSTLRARPISRVIDWPVIVAKYLEVTGGKKDNEDKEEEGGG